jgi:CHAT domain-containing protein
MKRKSFAILFSFIVASIFAQSSEFGNIQRLIDAENVIEAEKEILSIQDKTSGDYQLFYGDILLKKGDHQKALSTFEAAQVFFEQNKNSSIKLAKCYSQLGYIHWTMGNHEESLIHHEQALQIHKLSNNKKGIAASHNDIGLTYSNIDSEKALEYYQIALTDYKKLYEANDERIATAHINIGYINGKMDFQSDAFENFDKALEILEIKYGKDHPRRAFVYSNIGLIHFGLKEYEDARKYQEMALNIYQKSYGDTHPEVASTYNYLGNIYHEQGLHLAALQQFQEAICANIPNYNNRSIYDVTPIKTYYSADLLLISLQQKAQELEALHYSKTLKKKDLMAAWVNINSCDLLIDDIRRLKTNEADKIALGAIASEIYEDGIRTSVGLADVSWSKQLFQEKAFYFAEKSKSSVLLDAIADANAKSYANIPDDIIAKEQQLKTDIAYFKQLLAKSKNQSYQNELFSLENKYQAFTKSLEQNYPQYYNLKYNVNIPSISDITNILSDKEAVLSYFIAEKTDRLYTFYISKDKFRIHNNPKLKDLDRYLSGYRNSIYYKVKDIYTSTAVLLYNTLIPPIENHINSLTIIPVGRLGIVPFEALLTDEPKEHTAYENLNYLLKDYSVNTQYAAALMKPRSDKNNETSPTACILAPVSFSSHRLPELPATADEARSINDLFVKNGISSKSYTYSDANEINIKSEDISKSRYLHFATHGIVDEAKPELSQIFLSSASDEDGNLYTGEIYNLKLNADLVTLSACQTGLGKIYKGEGIVGLSRALLYAGANNMLVSLWSVADQSTANLMVDFYEKSLSDYSYTEGLQLAKKEMILGKKYSAPYYWAPFILIGQ